MERLYRFADTTFQISGNDEDMYQDDGVLTAFRVSQQAADHAVHYEIVDSLPEPEGECVFLGNRIQVFRDGCRQICCMGDTASLPKSAHTQIRRQGDQTRVQVLRREVPEKIKPRLVLNTLEAEHHIVRHGGILLHASFINWDGKGILFTAPSGTGKSTQAALWQRFRGVQILNGDRAAVMVTPEQITAHGIPYCGTSGICHNGILPVTAIVCLSQAPKSVVQPLSGLRAFRNLWEGCSVNVWDSEDVELCTKSLMEIVSRTTVLHLACTPDEEAVAVLEAYLKERR